MKASSAILVHFHRHLHTSASSCKQLASDFEQLKFKEGRNRKTRLKTLWFPGLLMAAVGLLGLSGCGTFVGTPNSAAAAGLLIALPSNVDFGSVPVGQTATATVSLINKSADPIQISQLTFTGQSFSILDPNSLPLTLAAGSTLKMTVEFGPTSSGTTQGQLAITSSLSPSPAVVVSLKGKGTTNGNGTSSGTQVLSINATTVSFGDVTLNTPSTQTVTLTATGTSSVTVNSATVTGTGFSISGATLPATLNSGQSISLSVQFDPTVTGAATGQLTISSNSSTNANAVIGLSGNGVASGSGASHEVDLSWLAPSNSPDPVAGYNVYRAPTGTSSYQLLNTAATTQTLYADLSVQSGASYDYVVRSVDASGVESSPSNVTTATIP